MKYAWMIVLAAGCSFDPRTAPTGDGATGDTITSDATSDATPDVAIDALPACPAPPSGCTAFSCGGSTSCYYECERVNSYTAARDGCSTRGLGCLVSIDGAPENTCIATQVAPVFNSKLLYFGFRQDSSGAEPAGGWGWECPASGFTVGNWGSVEPNNDGGNEDCGLMIQDGAWIDGICGASGVYVCEFPR